MKLKLSLVLLMLLFAIKSCRFNGSLNYQSSKFRSDSSQKISFQELKKNLPFYSGKSVCIKGYYVCDIEASTLFESSSLTDFSIWIYFNDPKSYLIENIRRDTFYRNIVKCKDITKRYIEVCGKIDLSGKGHLRLHDCSLDEIESIRIY